MYTQLSPSRLLRLTRFMGVSLVSILLFGGATSWSHNLDMQINYLIFDKDTTALVQSRAASNQPLMQAGDTVGVILKATPNAGTKTGAGGYSTFFVPVGSQVVGAEYGVVQDNGTFQPLPMKGQSILVHGNGPVDPQVPAELRDYVIGPNVLGVSSKMAETKGFAWGTLAGLYGDTGIFYSTDPATAWQSWANSGGIDKNPATSDNTIRNNKGDYIVPTTLWDAYQMFGFGIKSPVNPVIDPDGRGSTPWGTGTPVAGPESGYAWGFNKAYWDANPSNPNRMRNSIQVGPWKRLRYPGSEITKDTPGRRGTELDLVGVNGSEYGVTVSPGSPLPPTTSWTDTTSPKAIRLSWGGLELYRPEYCRIKVKILKNPGESGAPFDPNGYLQLFGETFGGDAGGEYGNKDHVWRYYKPSVIGLSASPMIEMIASKKIVLPNELFHFDVRITNLGNLPMTNAILENPLPSALTFVSATPAQNAGPSALRWNLGTLPPQSTRTFRINVRANTTGLITNKATIRSTEFPTPKEASDTVTSDFIAIMYGDKIVTPSTAAPGAKVVYKIVVRNDGACPNRSPWKVREFLPEGFKYTRTVDQFINGARTSNTVVVPSSSNINRPEFVINKALDVGKTLEIFFEAELSNTQAPGQYFNRYAVDYDDKVYATGLIAPVTVGGAKVGDLVFQDWNGNGTRDGNEPGLNNITLQLWTDPNSDGNPADGILVRSTTTNGQGDYNFGGTSAGNYVVKVSGGVPSGYQLTSDPEGPLDGLAKLSLTNSSDRLDIDFGYKPQGTLAVSGLVFSDIYNNGTYESANDLTINGVPVTLHFDANGNGVVDAPDIQIASTTSSSGGTYSFANIAPNLSYVVAVSTTAPALTSFFDPFAFKPSSPAVIALGSLTASASDRNFAFFADRPATIGDQVFQDVNRNAIFDSGDVAIPMVSVKIHRDLNNNKIPDAGEYVRATTTDNRGQYLFSDLSGDNYVVEIDLADPDVPGGLALAPPYIPVTVLPGETNLTIDFALKRVLNLSVNPTGTVAPGSRLTYSLQANYPQVGQFNSVSVSDTLPPGTTLASGTISTGGSFASNTVTWNLGSTASSVARTYLPVINCVRNIRIEIDDTVDDTYIRADSPSTVLSSGNMFLRPSSASTQRQALIRFLTTEIPAGATVLSATVGLRVSNNRSNQTVNLYPLNTAWDVNSATWNDPNGAASGRWASGSTFSSLDYNSSLSLGSFTPNSAGYKLVTSTNLKNTVQSWVNDPSSNRGIGIITFGSDTGDVQLFSIDSTVNNRPYLDVQYTYVAADACGVDSRGAAYWARNGLLNGRTAAWNGGSFDATQTTPPLAADLEFIVGAASSKRDEKIIAGIIEQTENNVVGQMWNGTGWSNLPINPLGKAGTTAEVGVAVAYEQLSGDAVLVWTDRYQPSGLQLRYSIWNGTAWSTPTSITSYTGAEPSGMKIVAKPDSDEMTLIITDWNYSNHAIVWNGSSWNSSLLLENGVQDSNNIFDLAVAYETISGRAMVMYGKNNQRNVYYRLWNGSTWTNEAPLAGPSGMGDTRHLTASCDPGGNRIAVGVITEGSDAWCSVWNGTSWSTGNVVETDLNTRDAPTLGVAFESQSGDLLVAYSEKNHNGVKYRTWTTSGGWTTEQSALPLGNEANSLILQPDLNTNEIMLVVQDDNLDIVVTRWSDTLWKGYRELEDNSGESSKQPFIYLWDVHERNPNPPLTTAEGLVGPASIINNAQIVTVSTTLTASRNIESITAPDPSFISLSGSGLSATKLSGPTPGPSTIGQRGTTFSWSYRINGGTSPASALFRWSQFTVGDATFPATDSNSFIYVPTLSYQVDVTSPPPNPIITNQASINLGSGPVLSNTVETYLSESIGDLVWADYDMDGVQDSNEPGLPGVRVFIDANSNGLFDSGERNMTSNSQGLYTLNGVGVGTHAVAIDVVTLPLDYIVTTPTRLTRTLTAGQSSATCDFGVAPRPPNVAVGTIGGIVWIDSNADGIVDLIETGFSGVTTQLWRDNNADGLLDASDFLVASTTSGSDGRYQFDELYAGRYLVSSSPSPITGVSLVSGHTPLTGVISVNLTPSSNSPAATVANTSTLLEVSKGNYNIPITGATILRAGTTPITQTASASGVTLVTTDTIELVELQIVDEGEPKTLGVVNRGGGIVRNVSVSPTSTDYGVVNAGVKQSMSSLGMENFKKVAASTASNSNLNNYIDDGRGDLAPDGSAEYDIMFDLPYNLDDYVIMSERFGNSTARLTPLDEGGNVIANSNSLQVRPTYDWNTGIASPYQSGQPYWITAIRATTFGVNQPIYGFRVDTHGADIKFFGISDSLFIDNVGTSTTYLSANFGYNHNASIGDFVYYDFNGNGIHNPNGVDNLPGTADDEVGIFDATVQLIVDSNADGIAGPFEPVYGITSTNASGFYLFRNLPPGKYVAKVEEQSVIAPPGSDNAGLVGFMLPTTSETVPVTLAPAQAFLGADYGFIEKSIIEGYVFHDVDSSTLKDPEEPGIANVDVRIIGTDIRGNNVDLTVSTNAGGQYTHFVAPGSYTLTYNTSDPDLPSSLTRATTPLAYTLDVQPGRELEGLDFGRDHNGTLGGRVFNDDNGNGSQNRGEDGIPDITVQLFDSAGTTLLTTTTTDTRGDYRFTGLDNGTFTLVVLHSSLPLGYNTVPTADPDAVKDGRSKPAVNSTTPNLSQIFGYRHSSSTHVISGLIFDDSGVGGGTFANGARDGTEPGLAGASVRIDIDFDKDGIVDEYRVATSESTGDFISAGVPTGANILLYVVDRSLPRRAYAPTLDPNGPIDGRANLTAIITDSPGLVFGFALKPSTISGSVVVGDGNGIADPGELPLENVIVRLTYGGYDDVIGTADDSVITRTTNATGLYSAADLDPGVFQIVQSVPAGYKPRADADGGVSTNISLTVAPAALPTKQDFENYQLPQIRGRVLVDADRSGDISIDDTPVQGVTVRLFTDVNGNGLKDPEDTQVNTFVTDSLGVYRFGPISDPAKFLVQHDLPNTMISITDADGPANGTNHMAVAVEELDINNRDFLNRPIPMTLGGRVFNDLNSNALLDGTDSGVSALQVRLFDSASSQQIGTINTLADGSYSFPGLWPGNYFVQITPPSSLPSTGGTPVALDNDVINDSNALQPGGPGTAISSPVISLAVNTESITDGDTNPNTNLTIGLGLWSGLDIGNLVWNDSNNNGLKDTTESGISGISVRLFSPGSDNAVGGTGDAADTLINTVTTNTSGAYNFRVYTPGRYFVRLTPPSSFRLASTASVNLDNGINDDSNGVQLGSAGNDIVSPVILLSAGGEPGSAGTTNTEDTLDFGLRACPIVSISPTSVPAGSVYGTYTQAFIATGGVAPRTFRISSGGLPSGLSLSSGGVINGTINANPGSYWFRIEARDNQGCIGTRDYTLTVTCPNPTISPAGPALTDAWHWQPYSQTFTATGVAAAYTWSIASGSLPSGLTLNAATGVLAGTVTGAPGSYAFVVRATDPLGFCVTNHSLTLLVNARWDFGDLADSLTGTSPNTGNPTADYLTRLIDNGPRHSIRPNFHLGSSVDDESDGQPDFLADEDDDDDGLTLAPTIVAGSSTTATIAVTNTIGVTARANLWIDWNSNGSFEDSGERLVSNSTVTGSRSFNVTVPVGAVLNRPLGVRVRLTSYSLTNSLGVATDGEVEDYLITAVCPTVAISTPSLPAWYLGATTTQTFSASGGTAPYTWTLHSGALPPGLSLTTAGTVSGIPTAIGNYSFTLRATDAYGCSVTRAYTATIKGITVGNLVFNDTDDNGVRSAWELGVGGVTLEAYKPGADLAVGGTGANADTLIATIVTDSQGAYGFDNLPVGPIFIRLIPPASMRVTGGIPVTADNGVNNDNNGAQPGGPGTSLFSPVITLAAGLESIADGDSDPDTELSIDFGIWSGVGIGSTIYSDANSDGRIDPTETGLGSVKVELWRDVDGDVGNGAEVYVAETITNVAGHYTFLGYPSGTYQIVVPNSNFVPGGPLNAAPFASPVRAYSDDQIDDDSNAIQFLGGGTEARSPLISLAAGDEPVGSGLGGVNGEFGRGGDLDDNFPDENADLTVDMGFVAPGSAGVGNLVFVDNNDNGRAEADEGVNGITVQLFYAGDNPLTDPPLLTTTTANGGRYLFSIVWEGNFFVYLPKQQFTPSGLLNATFPIPTIVAGDDELGQDAMPTTQPWITGVRSQDFNITFGSAPTAATGETGTDASSDDAFDSSSNLTIDIGLFRSVGLGNLVFFDVNENGRADAGEGASGVLLELYRENQTPGFHTPVKTTSTQASGEYLFDLIPTGSYRVHIPASQFANGMPLFRGVSIAEGLSGDDDVGEDGINAANPALTGITSRLVTLIPGNTPTVSDGETGTNASSDDDFDSAVDLTIDFGFQNPVGLGNLVFVDFDDDGVFTAGEGISNVRVELYEASKTPGDDLPIFTQTTAADGHYFFGSLSAGDYKVHIPASQFRPGAALANLIPLAQNSAGDDDAGQNGFTSGMPAVTGVSTDVISLSSGSSPMNFTSETGHRNTDDDLYDNNFDLTVDLGFAPPTNTTVGVGNLVYRDTNGNGDFDSGEGVSGVMVQLFIVGEDPQTSTPTATASTDADGLYLFTGLTPGDYFLHIPGSQFLVGAPLASLFSLPGNGIDNGNDDDIDENGIDSATPAATGISSSPFNLALGTEPINDSSEFGQGTYLDDLADSNHDLTFDFGFYESVGLGNLVFIDTNGNGTADSGEGVPSVQVELYSSGSVPGWNTPLATTTTDSLGRYAFNDLRPGSYMVHIPYTQFQSPAPLHGLLSLTGAANGDDDIGEDGLDESQPEWNGITSAPVSLTPNSAPSGAQESGLFGTDDDAQDALFDATVDFGFAARMAIGNLVFSDTNGDGIFDPATEFGVEGVEVELWHDANTTSPAATTQTQADGSYGFSVAPGNYSVRIPASEFQPGAPLAYNQASKNIASTIPSTDGDDNIGQDGLNMGDPAMIGVTTPLFALTPGNAPTSLSGEAGYLGDSDDTDDTNSDLTIDLGFSPKPLAVGNLVFRDLNADGRFTSGTDQPIVGVPLRLFRVGDNPQTATPVAMTLSAADGTYLLKTPTAGTYYVNIPSSAFAPTGVLSSATPVSGFGDDDGTDDDSDQNGIWNANPVANGINSNSFELTFGTEPVTAANAPGMETGAFANSDSLNEAITDLTIDFGFVGGTSSNLSAIGNVVYRDTDSDNVFDEGEGVDGVWMILYDATAPAGPGAQLASTFTSGGGRYFFSNLPAGQYVVHVAADNFKPFISLNGGTPAPGPLFEKVSANGVGSGDDNLGEDGIDNALPAQFGINSGTISIAPGTAPLEGSAETGASLSMNNILGDENTDLTVDFAFVAAPPAANSLRETNTLTLASGSTGEGDPDSTDSTPAAAPETYLEWQSRHALGSLSAPDQDADKDGVSNLLEYALELDPLSGLEQRSAISFDTSSGLSLSYTRPSNGHQDTRYQIEVLPDLNTIPAVWTTLATPSSTIQNPDGTETLHFYPPAGWSQGFVRLNIALDSDGNGSPEASSTSQVSAWLTPTLATGQQTLGQPLVQHALYTGPVQRASAASVSLSINSDIASSLVAGREYYLELTSGHRFEIEESTSQNSTLMLDMNASTNTASSLPADLNTSRAAIREHWSLANLLPASVFAASDLADTADRALFFNTASNQFDIRWLQSGSPATWTTTTNAPNHLAPGSALIVHRRSTPVTLLWTGLVRDHAFKLTLKPGTQLVAPGFPATETPSSLGLTEASGFVSGNSATTSDRFRLWIGDSQPGSSGYYSFFFLQTTGASSWINQADASLQDLSTTPLFAPTRGLFIQRLPNSPAISPTRDVPVSLE